MLCGGWSPEANLAPFARTIGTLSEISGDPFLSDISGDTFLSVKIEQFAASSIDIRLICFTKTKQYLEWMNVKDILAIEIKSIVEKNKASFAFPSTSVYVEKN